MNKIFPYVEFENWPQCDRLLSQAQHCASLIITHKLQFSEGARLLNQCAFYLQERARYTESESFCQRALAIYERALGPTHPDVARSLNNLGLLYFDQRQYAKAEALFKSALALRELALEPTHPDVAGSLTSLAALYRNQGKYAEAMPLYQRGLAIQEQVLGPNHPVVPRASAI